VFVWGGSRAPPFPKFPPPGGGPLGEGRAGGGPFLLGPAGGGQEHEPAPGFLPPYIVRPGPVQVFAAPVARILGPEE